MHDRVIEVKMGTTGGIEYERTREFCGVLTMFQDCHQVVGMQGR